MPRGSGRKATLSCKLDIKLLADVMRMIVPKIGCGLGKARFKAIIDFTVARRGFGRFDNE
jgi:hypothetical protein